MKIYFTGLGFTLGWLWAFFLNGPLLSAASTRWNYNSENIFIIFMLFNSFSYLAIATVARRLSPLISRRLLLLTGAVLMSAGPLLVFFIPGESIFTFGKSLTMAAAAISGVGAAILITCWGELYSNLSIKTAGLSFAAAVLLGTVLLFLNMLLSPEKSMIILGLYPFLSLIFLILGDKRRCFKERPDAADVISFPFTVKFAVLVILFYLAGGMMYKIIVLGSYITLETYWYTCIFYGVVCLFAGTCIYFYPELDLRLLYRPVLPLLGAGFLLFPVLNNFLKIPLSFSQAGFALFDTYTWLYFAYLAARYRYPSVVFGWGMFLITFSIFAGESFFTIAFNEISLTPGDISVVSLAAALIMLLATQFFQGNKETFSGWKKNEGLPEQAETVYNVMKNTDIVGGETGESVVEPGQEQEREPVLTDMLTDYFIDLHKPTNKEREIIVLLLQGRNNPYIREALNISNNTLKTHLRNIYQKFSVSNRQDLLSLYNNHLNAHNA